MAKKVQRLMAGGDPDVDDVVEEDDEITVGPPPMFPNLMNPGGGRWLGGIMGLPGRVLGTAFPRASNWLGERFGDYMPGQGSGGGSGRIGNWPIGSGIVGPVAQAGFPTLPTYRPPSGAYSTNTATGGYDYLGPVDDYDYSYGLPGAGSNTIPDEYNLNRIHVPAPPGYMPGIDPEHLYFSNLNPPASVIPPFPGGQIPGGQTPGGQPPGGQPPGGRPPHTPGGGLPAGPPDPGTRPHPDGPGGEPSIPFLGVDPSLGVDFGMPPMGIDEDYIRSQLQLENPFGLSSDLVSQFRDRLGIGLQQPPSFDDTDLQRRLSSLEGMEAPQFDPTTLQQRLSTLEGASEGVPSFNPFDPSGLQQRLTSLESQGMPSSFEAFDPTGLQRRLTSLEAQGMPSSFEAFDPTGLQRRLTSLEAQGMPSSFEAFDPTGLQRRLTSLESREMPTFNQFDPTGLQRRLTSLESQGMPSYQQFDPTDLQSQITALQNRQMPTFDPTGLQGQISALQDRGMFDPAGLQQQITSLQNRGGPDLSNFMTRGALETAIQTDPRLRGLQGMQGDIGLQGLQGIQGLIGERGFQGDIGLQGLPGDVGPQGIMGLMGLTGAIGPQGLQGFQGLEGMAGVPAQMQYDPYAAFRPSFAEGGPVKVPRYQSGTVDGMPAEMTDGDRQLVELTAAAIQGQLGDQADQVIQQFIAMFGVEAFVQLRDQVLSGGDESVTTEGLVPGQTGGMDDRVDLAIGGPVNEGNAAVSPGEYIVPADTVAALGDGNSNSGADKLDAMIKRIRVAKTGSAEQPPPIDSRRVMEGMA